MIRENILAIQQRIREICARSNRDPSLITIVAVSKGRMVAQIKEARESGIIDIGESKVQEAALKYKELSAIRYPCLAGRQALSTLKWHMLGHLQTNKVKDAVRIFDLIQSIDSLHLAQEINAHAFTIGKVQDILIEIKTSVEATKFGFTPEESVGVVQVISQLPHIRVRGLMTIAPAVDNPEQARPYFKALREIRDEINALNALRLPAGQAGYPLHALSMGMTDDFEVAIEEGATMVRLGRAVFER